MPIPFRDVDDVEELGAAAFLKLETSASGPGYLGALLLVNARGEPLELTYNRVETPHTFLWRPGDLRRHAERKLVASILSLAATVPRLLLCLADEVGGDLFGRDVRLAVPVGRIGRPLSSAAPPGGEAREVLELPEPLHLFWYPEAPAAESIERRLFDRLSSHGLLLEPFERAGIGLREIYPRVPEGSET